MIHSQVLEEEDRCHVRPWLKRVSPSFWIKCEPQVKVEKNVFLIFKFRIQHWPIFRVGSNRWLKKWPRTNSVACIRRAAGILQSPSRNGPASHIRWLPFGLADNISFDMPLLLSNSFPTNFKIDISQCYCCWKSFGVVYWSEPRPVDAPFL